MLLLAVIAQPFTMIRGQDHEAAVPDPVPPKKRDELANDSV